MQLLKLLREVKKALIIGIGGGGDVVSCVIIGKMLKMLDVKCIYGGVIWERFKRDPKPGPRSIEEIEECRKICSCLGWIGKDSRIGDLRLTTSQVAEYVEEYVVGIDISKGEKNISACLGDFIELEGIDIVIGVDAGGDALARGDEPRLISPLADAIMIAALNKLPSVIAITGFGSDGELQRDEIERYLSEIAEKQGLLGVSMLTKEEAESIYPLIGKVETEASKVPVLAALGYYGDYILWEGHKIKVSALNSLIFYLDTRVVYEFSPLPKLVEGSESIEEANEMLHQLGIKTELDLERELCS
jgi:hypothetical protein